MTSTAPQCQALSLSDKRRCNSVANTSNALFCQFHAHQCYGLYKGYKRRNVQLDDLIDNPPLLLQQKPLHELDLAQVDDEQVLADLHGHLLRRYTLLERVIRARRLHHSQFYALELDYGHEQYINSLSAQRTPVLRALECVVRRSAEVAYQKQKWFDWVRQLENEEERDRDAEKKKVKQEAALFQRHVKDVESRMRQLRACEDAKRQSDILNKVWEERQRNSPNNLNEDTVEDTWDPVEDSFENERGNYVELIRHFLWQSLKANQSDTTEEHVIPFISRVQDSTNKLSHGQPTSEEASIQSQDVETKSKSVKKRARRKANPKLLENTDAKVTPKEQTRPGNVHIESKSGMRARLRVGQEYKHGMKYLKKGTFLEPEELESRSPSLEEAEIDKLTSEVSEIKELLFCRSLLAHAALLPAALRANTIDEFLADEEVGNIDLRDLCLKMEQPSLQELRDACADFRREEDASNTDGVEDDDAQAPEQRALNRFDLQRAIPKSFQTKREKEIKAQRQKSLPAEFGAIVDFGDIDDQGQYQIKTIKIKVCGKTIYNYPSEAAMSRGGWLQFSVIAKDCELEDVVKLCRNWEEFYELITLTMYNYFPASGWVSFLGVQEKRQLFTLGFFPYFQMDEAERLTRYHQTSRNQPGPRQHQVIEARNFICGQMKRNDSVSRRFIQYVALKSSSLVMLVRDTITGNVIVQPPDDSLWLVRKKSGFGRSIKSEWNDIKTVGPAFLEEIDGYRQWSLDFKDYYDFVIWDMEPGLPPQDLINDIQTLLFKAHRMQTGAEIYRPAESILRSITWDEERHRARDMESPGGHRSIWDMVNDSTTRHVVLNVEPRDDGSYAGMLEEWKYSEADRLEDEVLFPWEHTHDMIDSAEATNNGVVTASKRAVAPGTESILTVQQHKLHELESNGPDIARFVLDLDTDDEASDTEIADATKALLGEKPSATDHDAGNSLDDELDSIDDSDSFEDSIDEDELGLSDELSSAMKTMFNLWSQWRLDDQFASAAIQRRIKYETSQSPSLKQLKRFKKEEVQDEYDQVAEDFDVFMDRTKANVFRDCWHKADLEPFAQQRWVEYKSLMAAQRKWLKPDKDESTLIWIN